MKVAITRNEQAGYCKQPPFHPPEKYPEYPFGDLCSDNPCYGEVRDVLYRLGLDKEHFGTPEWNPLGEVIRPGDRVFLKPNMVSHRNNAGSVEAIITQGSVIRAVLDYVFIALQGKGSIGIGDAPFFDTDFPEVVRLTGLQEVVDYYRDVAGMHIDLLDLRQEKGQVRFGALKKEPLPGDPKGYAAVDLKGDSAHAEIIGQCDRFRLGYYDKNELVKHHNRDRNEYPIAGSILQADVIINLPKLKTHGKAGITCALKNLVGINVFKGWLPHHRAGSAERGGDDYERSDFRQDLMGRLKDEIPSQSTVLTMIPLRAACGVLFFSKYLVPFRADGPGGSWHGNDTIPRTISDLNRIIFYADKNGVMQKTPQRRMFILVDGITGGEKEGPMRNTAKPCGVLIAGTNPVAVDLISSMVMGFDYRKIPTFKYAMNAGKYPIFTGAPEDIRIFAEGCLTPLDVYHVHNCHFVPADGWQNYVEYRPEGKIDSTPLQTVAAR
ncbi:DUF362 domain-containing protein [Methanocella arvoryzae]|uniref:DUF362 domain-containing protein n=1 Tax=Methanocella arvoryzae (strain DSM 22066 / NBRC 105507 / MRE50) TaxID=351160 RepID=Q0W3E2_METAR|nr:DUF362 domain-containing protein [Methanocella arvoryzae]CAJ37101.1 conserved hypothetical protein [Methanocella arvoryzae MRE50]